MPGQNNATEAHTLPYGLLSLSHGLSRLRQSVLDLIYPPCCSGCGLPDTNWCPRCQQKLDQYPFEQYLRTINTHFSAASTGLYNDELRDAIWGLKYEGGTRLAEPLAERIVSLLNDLPYQFDYLIPVPIHAARLEQRGYNQAKLLADYVSQLTHIPNHDSVIVRHQNTRSQVGLTPEERKQNVTNAFTHTDSLKDLRVLLIDDVLTTGATLSACAEAAYRAGAVFVFGITVAHAKDLGSQ